MRKPCAFLLSTLTISTILVPALAGTAAAAPTANDKDLERYLLRVPLPEDDSDLKIITPEKYQKLNEAFCTTNSMSAEMLADIDKVYKNVLPVTFGTPDTAEDPIGKARLKVLGTAALTDDARKRLCTDVDVQADYYEALVQQIEKAETTPVPELRAAGLTAEKKGKITTKIWTDRLMGFKAAFQHLLTGTEI
ncbi:hypothetical protein [Nocardia brasiliensis]|uniref:hypothetical protein n=1 Tax=Nocardia brasiliensis TaxID=37326 RepID=UPI00366A568B